jgi:antitoxin component HigA of HigAB toxin-antitoxin module
MKSPTRTRLRAQPIRAYLTRTGQSQADFAASVGTKPSHLSMILAGKRGLSVDLLFTIARHINVSMDRLVSKADPSATRRG